MPQPPNGIEAASSEGMLGTCRPFTHVEEGVPLMSMSGKG